MLISNTTGFATRNKYKRERIRGERGVTVLREHIFLLKMHYVARGVVSEKIRARCDGYTLSSIDEIFRACIPLPDRTTLFLLAPRRSLPSRRSFTFAEFIRRSLSVFPPRNRPCHPLFHRVRHRTRLRNDECKQIRASG